MSDTSLIARMVRRLQPVDSLTAPSSRDLRIVNRLRDRRDLCSRREVIAAYDYAIAVLLEETELVTRDHAFETMRGLYEAAEAERSQAVAQLRGYQEREAALCPEDVEIDEWCATLKKRADTSEAALTQFREGLQALPRYRNYIDSDTQAERRIAEPDGEWIYADDLAALLAAADTPPAQPAASPVGYDGSDIRGFALGSGDEFVYDRVPTSGAVQARSAADVWAKLPPWARTLLTTLDRRLNARLGGDPAMTISERLARGRNAGELEGIVGCALLDHVDAGHCDRAIQSSKTFTPAP